MKRKSQWTLQQDLFLKEQHAKINCKKKWVRISQLLKLQFPEKMRSPKQCRERFINFVLIQDQKKLSQQWSVEQDNILFELYQKNGSRWNHIAQNLPGRSQNNIKNKFYSKLRKIVRMFNRLRKISFQKPKKQIRFESVMRVLDAPQSLASIPIKMMEKAKQIRQQIIHLMFQKQKQPNHVLIWEIIEQTNQFNLKSRSYKTQKLKFNLLQAKNGQIESEERSIAEEKQLVQNQIHSIIYGMNICKSRNKNQNQPNQQRLDFQNSLLDQSKIKVFFQRQRLTHSFSFIDEDLIQCKYQSPLFLPNAY